MNALELKLVDDVVAAQAGDQTAFSRLAQATQGLLTSSALSITRDVRLSEEIAQDVLLKVWRQLGTLKNPASFLPWLRKVVRHASLSGLRAQKRHRADAGALGEVLLAQVVDEGGDSADPVQRLSRDQQAVQLRSLLALLKPSDRELLTLYFREHESTQQVANLLGISDQTVRQRLSRARARLKSDWIARFGALAVVTAPMGAWSLALGTAMVGVTPAASAASFSAAKAAGASHGAAAMLSSMIAGLGLLLALFAVNRGLQPAIWRAQNERQRHAFVRLRVHAMVIVAGTFFALILAPNAAVSLTVYGLFVCGLGWLYSVRLRRLLRPIREAELALDPNCKLIHRKADIWGTVGLIGGALAGALGLLAGLFHSGSL